MYYMYDDGQYIICTRLAPQTARAAQDCLAGPLTLEQAREWASAEERSVIWR